MPGRAMSKALPAPGFFFSSEANMFTLILADSFSKPKRVPVMEPFSMRGAMMLKRPLPRVVPSSTTCTAWN